MLRRFGKRRCSLAGWPPAFVLRRLPPALPEDDRNNPYLRGFLSAVLFGRVYPTCTKKYTSRSSVALNAQMVVPLIKRCMDPPYEQGIGHPVGTVERKLQGSIPRNLHLSI